MLRIIPLKKDLPDNITPFKLNKNDYINEDGIVFYFNGEKNHEEKIAKAVLIDFTKIFDKIEHGFIVRLVTRSDPDYITIDRHNSLCDVDMIEIPSGKMDVKYRPKFIIR